MKFNKPIEEIKNDYHLFIDIQRGKYLKSVNQSEFRSDQEAQNILGKIIEAYSNLIAPGHERLDNSTIEAKATWFNSLQIDYSAKSYPTNSETYKSKIRTTSKEMVLFYDKIFPYLPPGSIIFLLFSGPALEAYGYPFLRFKKLMNAEKPTEIEKDILRWAYSVTMYLLAAYTEKTETEKNKFFAESLNVVQAELEPDVARKVIAEIYANIEEHFAYMKEIKTKSERKSS